MDKKTCGNSCKLFDYDFDQGAKAFSAAEFFLAFWNLRSMADLCVICAYKMQSNAASEVGLSVKTVMEGLSMIVFIVTLLVQTVMGWCLYFVGWKKRNVTVTYVWLASAIINFFYPTFIYLIFYQHIRTGFDVICEYYLLYNAYGAWIMYNFVKWAESAGVATEFRLPIPEADDEEDPRPRPARKTKTRDDNEGGEKKGGGGNKVAPAKVTTEMGKEEDEAPPNEKERETKLANKKKSHLEVHTPRKIPKIVIDDPLIS